MTQTKEMRTEQFKMRRKKFFFKLGTMVADSQNRFPSDQEVISLIYSIPAKRFSGWERAFFDVVISSLSEMQVSLLRELKEAFYSGLMAENVRFFEVLTLENRKYIAKQFQELGLYDGKFFTSDDQIIETLRRFKFVHEDQVIEAFWVTIFRYIQTNELGSLFALKKLIPEALHKKKREIKVEAATV